MTSLQYSIFRSEESVRRTWISWSEILAYPGASPFVVNFDDASDDLIRIYDRGFPKEQMEEWLREWPTQLGWETYLNRQEQRRN